MKYYFITFPLVIFLFACSSNEPQIPINTPPANIDVYTILENYGLTPSEIDSINWVGQYKEEDNYKILTGQKNHNAWISKFDKTGNELFSYELKPDGGWKYSVYYNEPILYVNNKYVFARGLYTNIFDVNSENYFSPKIFGERISILDFTTGKEINKLDILRGSSDIHYQNIIIESNERYLIHREEVNHSGSIVGLYNTFSVINSDGDILYTKPWRKDKEEELLGEGFIFLDDERVTPILSKKNKINFSIVNLRQWELLRKYDNDELKLLGDRRGEENIIYDIDTTYMEGDNIKYIYDEICREYKTDEITGVTTIMSKIVDKYYYHININDYSVTYMGKLKP